MGATPSRSKTSALLSDFPSQLLDLVHRLFQLRHISPRHALTAYLPGEVADRTFNPVHTARNLFRTGLLVRRLDRVIERHHPVAGIHVDAHQIRNLVSGELSLHRGGEMGVIDILPQFSPG